VPAVRLDEPLQGLRAGHGAVAQRDYEVFGGRELLATRDRVAQPQGAALADCVEACGVGGETILAGLVGGVIGSQAAGRVEVVLDRALAVGGHEEDVGHTGGGQLLSHGLNDRPRAEGQHLLRLRLRDRIEPRTAPGRGDNRSRDLH